MSEPNNLVITLPMVLRCRSVAFNGFFSLDMRPKLVLFYGRLSQPKTWLTVRAIVNSFSMGKLSSSVNTSGRHLG